MLHKSQDAISTSKSAFGKNGILLKLLIFRRMEELRKAKPDFILNEVPFSSSPFLFKGLRFERSLLGGKVPC